MSSSCSWQQYWRVTDVIVPLDIPSIGIFISPLSHSLHLSTSPRRNHHPPSTAAVRVAHLLLRQHYMNENKFLTSYYWRLNELITCTERERERLVPCQPMNPWKREVQKDGDDGRRRRRSNNGDKTGYPVPGHLRPPASFQLSHPMPNPGQLNQRMDNNNSFSSSSCETLLGVVLHRWSTTTSDFIEGYRGFGRGSGCDDGSPINSCGLREMGESMLPKPTLLVPLHLYSKVCPLELTNHLEELLGGKIQPNQQPTTTCTLEMVTQQWWWWVHAKGRLPLLELYYYYYYYPFGLSIHPSFDKLYPEISSQWTRPNGQQQAQDGYDNYHTVRYVGFHPNPLCNFAK